MPSEPMPKAFARKGRALRAHLPLKGKVCVADTLSQSRCNATHHGFSLRRSWRRSRLMRCRDGCICISYGLFLRRNTWISSFFAADMLSINALFTRHATSSTASGPPSPQGEGIVAGTLCHLQYFFATAKLLSRSTNKLFCGAPIRGKRPPPGGINGFNRVKDSGSGSKVYKRYLQPPGDGRFCPITTV